MKLFLLPLVLGLGHVPPPAKPPITLLGYFACRASELAPDGDGTLACYAPIQQGCQQGAVVLAYERRVAFPDDGAFLTIEDTVQLTLRKNYHDLTIARCAVGTGRPRQYFVLRKRPALGKKYLRHVLRVWGLAHRVNSWRCRSKPSVASTMISAHELTSRPLRSGVDEG